MQEQIEELFGFRKMMVRVGKKIQMRIANNYIRSICPSRFAKGKSIYCYDRHKL